MGTCGVGTNYVSVGLDGKVQMCSYTQGVLGNLFDTSLLDIWQNHEQMLKYRSGDWFPEKCKVCERRQACAAGCKMSGNSDTFTPDILLAESYNESRR